MTASIVIILGLVMFLYAGEMNKTLHTAYELEISKTILDSNGALLERSPNKKGII